MVPVDQLEEETAIPHNQEVTQHEAEPDNQEMATELSCTMNNNQEAFEIVSSIMEDIITTAVNGRVFVSVEYETNI